MKPKLQVSRVSFSYHSKNRETLALSDISFNVDTGEFIAIVGPSGCGKSTLLSLLCGLNMPEAGAIFLDGELLEKNPKNATGIGYMFQKDHLFECRGGSGSKIFPLTVKLVPIHSGSVHVLAVAYQHF